MLWISVYDGTWKRIDMVIVTTHVLSPEDLFDDEGEYNGVCQKHQDNWSNECYKTRHVGQPTTEESAGLVR